jgi:hypothetical protein
MRRKLAWCHAELKANASSSKISSLLGGASLLA